MRSAALLAPLVLFAPAGCTDDRPKPDQLALNSNYSVEQAKEFREFPVYYAGTEVAGLPLSSVNRTRVTAPPGTAVAKKLAARGEVDSVDFTYGSCPLRSADEGCSIPLTIQVWPACARYPALYDGGFSPKPQPTTIRGVPAAYFEGGYRLEIQTGASTIVIFGNRGRMRRAVAALSGLNTSVKPGEPLPVPVRGALDGSLAC